jgi:hypothetical protein
MPMRATGGPFSRRYDYRSLTLNIRTGLLDMPGQRVRLQPNGHRLIIGQRGVEAAVAAQTGCMTMYPTAFNSIRIVGENRSGRRRSLAGPMNLHWMILATAHPT